MTIMLLLLFFPSFRNHACPPVPLQESEQGSPRGRLSGGHPAPHEAAAWRLPLGRALGRLHGPDAAPAARARPPRAQTLAQRHRSEPTRYVVVVSEHAGVLLRAGKVAERCR